MMGSDSYSNFRSLNVNWLIQTVPIFTSFMSWIVVNGSFTIYSICSMTRGVIPEGRKATLLQEMFYNYGKDN